MSQPAPSLFLRPRAAARLSMPDLRLSARSPFSPIQKKPCPTTSFARAARSLCCATSPSCLRNASRVGSLMACGAFTATGLYGPGLQAAACRAVDLVPSPGCKSEHAGRDKYRTNSRHRSLPGLGRARSGAPEATCTVYHDVGGWLPGKKYAVPETGSPAGPQEGATQGTQQLTEQRVPILRS